MKRYILIAAALLFASSSVVQAQEIKPYAGVGVGGYSLDFGLTSSETVVGGFVYFGVDLHENIAAEVRVGTTANASYLNVIDYGVDWMISYFAKPQLELADGFKVYALLGGTTMKTQFGSNLPGSLTNTSTDFSYGGGAEFKVSGQQSIGIEWVQYAKNADITNPVFPGLDVSGFSATFKHQF